LKEYLEELIGCLNCRERDIIRMRYGVGEIAIGLSVEETAKLMNMSIERVNRIESRALLKLRRCAQEKQLNAYLAS
jgi:RNA polymerase sigma factor (sigma-70 family)